MVVELISVGTEILLGNITNTNASYLAEECAKLGLSNYYQVTVGDNEERLSQALETALSRADVVIMTGGLGPTEDDLTKEVAAKVMGRQLINDEHSKERIKSYFSQGVQATITDNNWKQALIPEGATVIDNHNGTAPGLIISSEKGKHVILMPGPPNEMYPMFQNDIAPFLNKLEPDTIYSKTVKITGLGESYVESQIKDLLKKQTNPTIAPYAKTGEVHLRVTAKAENKTEAKKLIKPVVKELKHRFGSYIYTTKEKITLEDHLIELMNKHGLTLSAAESCSGGLFSGRMINVAGASDVFMEGIVTYSNEAKMKYLNVKSETLEKHGAVSKQTARQMAKGMAKIAKTSAAVSITGIAGPGGGSEDKPVGLVYVGCYINGQVCVKKLQLRGDRQKIRDYSVVRAMDFLRQCILECCE